MWQGSSPQPSYDNALRNTFATTYRKSYKNVDTIQNSPYYSERMDYSVTPQDTTYERESYPYQDEHRRVTPRYEDPREETPQRGYYDYNREFYNGPLEGRNQVDRQPRPVGSEYVRRQYNEVLARPEERQMEEPYTARNACVACRGPETQILKCTNLLGCTHKYCDNCIRNLHATDGPFRDRTALFYYCGICRNSRTPAPKIVKFDPYGRRIMNFRDHTDKVNERP